MLNYKTLIPISTLFSTRCETCGRYIPQGTPVLWDKTEKKVYHHGCVGRGEKVTRTLSLDERGVFHLAFEKNNFFLESLVRQIAGTLYNQFNSTWYLEEVTPVSARQLLDLAENHVFEFDSDVLNRLAKVISSGTEAMLKSMAKTSSFKVEGLNFEPYPFQINGIEFGINNRRVIIADQMGLGKTIQAMGIIAHLELFPTLIVCPAIIKLNWQREILSWITGIDLETVWTLQGTKAHVLPKAKIYIINYDILGDWYKILQRINLRAIIFDEFHYLKSSTSIRGKVARELARDREYVIGLTGTPILNRPEELIHPLRIIDRLKEVGGKDYFEKRYCDAHKDNYGRWNTSGAANLPELNERLRSNGIIIRRTKTEVLPDLPPKLPPKVIPINLTNVSEYRKAELDLARWLAQRAIEDEQFKESIRHLIPIEQVRATANHRRSVEYLARKNQERTKFIYLKRLATEGKLAGIQEYIRTFLETGEKLLVFGYFIDTQLDISKLWPQAVHVLGADSPKQRAEAIDKFQSDPNCKLMIASLKVLGIGVNLTAASHVAFVELGWTPADHDQAEDRLHRIGQTMPVNPIYFIGNDSIDEDIIQIIDRKRKVIGAATDGVQANDEAMLNLLIGRLLAKHGNRKK